MENVSVTVNGSVDRALREFKKQCGKARIITEFKKRMFFESKKEIERHKKMRAKRKQQMHDKENHIK